MARTTGSEGGKTEAALRKAAVSLIARHGYEAVSMRQLAARIGLQAAALYRYFPAKQDLLFTLMREHMETLIGGWEAASPSTDDPAIQLAAFIDHHIRFHLERRDATHVSNMELRSLSPDRLARILHLRGNYEQELRTILHQGKNSSDFEIDDVGLTAIAIIQMITGVIVWFRPDEPLSIKDLSKTYLSMTMRLVGARISWGGNQCTPIHSISD